METAALTVLDLRRHPAWLREIAAEAQRRPSWQRGFVLACDRCKTPCVGEYGCACCKERRMQGHHLGASLAQEFSHYAVCRVAEIVSEGTKNAKLG